MVFFYFIFVYLSALHYAAGHQKADVVNFLLSQEGIIADSKDVSGLGARGVVFENGKYVYKPFNLPSHI